MNDKSHEIALFRLMVLGALAARTRLERGELKRIIHDLAGKAYNIPYSKHCYLSEQTIERWYQKFKRHGFDGLLPKRRSDHGRTHIAKPVQDAIITFKKDNPSRSINTLIHLLTTQGIIARDELSRASLHRFLRKNNLSKRILSDAHTIERRSFEAQYACELWQGDVMHGPRIQTPKGKRKVYLVSLMDDASRLMTHSAFCWGETALDIEGVLKQALLKRGVPKTILIDNGSAYRAKSLQIICARLGIRLVYGRAYEPQGKGKIERFHRTFREQFLSELVLENIKDMGDLNGRLWAWIDEVYNQRPHAGLGNNLTPIMRWRQDLMHIQSLGDRGKNFDHYFYHRVKRRVKRDGSISWQGHAFEVSHTLSGSEVYLVVEPHEEKAIKIESLEGDELGGVYPLDKSSNFSRQRQRPASTHDVIEANKPNPSTVNVVEDAYQRHQEKYQLPDIHINPLPEEN